MNTALNLSPRPATIAMKKTGKKNIVAVEVGVFYGDNARSILRTLDIEHLYLIDPYKTYTCGGFEVKMDSKILKEAKKKLKPWEDKISWVHKYSDIAIHEIPDADFIYLDANHDYDFIKKDLQRYYKKMKSGGVFCGHDMKVQHLGTIRAVVEFTNECGLELHAEPDDWWFEVP
jgi:hypothetical protein